VTEKNIDLDCLKMKAKELAYTSVGIGILTFQKAQVRRRELSEEIDKEFPHAKAFVVKQVETTVSNIAMVMTSLLNSRRGTQANK
jgi:predicted membrane chloride channel (bestrophin family)